jgi:hypothetical protein
MQSYKTPERKQEKNSGDLGFSDKLTNKTPAERYMTKK